eukprot:312350-Prymnesium_polylepis.1
MSPGRWVSEHKQGRVPWGVCIMLVCMQVSESPVRGPRVTKVEKVVEEVDCGAAGSSSERYAS